MPQTLKTLCLIHLWGWENYPFPLLAPWGNKNWPSSMKVNSMENFQNKCCLNGCTWSSLNAPSTGNPLYHPIWKLGEFLFLMSLLRLGVSRTFLAFSRFCKCCFPDMRHARGREPAGGSDKGYKGRSSFLPKRPQIGGSVGCGMRASQQSDKKDDGMTTRLRKGEITPSHATALCFGLANVLGMKFGIWLRDLAQAMDVIELRIGIT